MRALRSIPGLAVLVLACLAAPSAAQTPSGVDMQITSPLGRTGMIGPVRIVARIVLPAGLTIGPVRFFVDGTLVGEDRDGAPYAVEWLDENPTEAREIAAETVASNGQTVRTDYHLRPLEVVDRSQISSVLLEPSVRTKLGRPVNGLSVTDFAVTEDGVPQTAELKTDDIVPAMYTLLIDTSQSMSRRMPFVRDAARMLPQRLRPQDSVTVVPFSTELGVVTGPTRDAGTVMTTIQGIQAKGGTAILDCLKEAVTRLRTQTGRQIVVIFTDGYDENSTATYEETLEAVRESRATVYVVAIGGVAGISLKGEALLKRLTAASGGMAYFPSRDFQLTDIHDQIASDVQQRYLLTYTPTNQRPDGTWRDVRVTTTDPAHEVLVRPGYRAPEPPPIRPQIELTVRDLTRSVLDITPADFIVLEDGVEQTVEGFQEALTPVSIMLVLDQSGSMRNDAAAVVEAARAFARQLPGKDRVGVTLFADSVDLVQDLSTIREWILKAIDKYRASGGTALYDAMTASLARLKKAEGRTAIVLLTDGRDENNPGTAPGSVSTWPQVLEGLTTSGTTVYAIGLGPKVDRPTIEQLATVSRGESYFPEQVASLAAEYRRILEDLRRRYVLSYTSSNHAHDGAWRTVEIRPRHEGLAVTATGGYFAPRFD